LANHLLKLGITETEAFDHARMIIIEIQKNYKKEILGSEVYEVVKKWYKSKGSDLASRINIISNDFREVTPLIILLGGVTGVGKSTIAKILGRRLGVRTILGTDLIREVMRSVLSEKLMPTLHQSSYTAYRKSENIFLPAISPVILGYEEQARKVLTGVEATITQAIKSKEFVILEGVHLLPSAIHTKIMVDKIVIPFQLYLEDKAVHLSRLKKREATSTTRTNYSKNFKEIREIHTYLNENALQQGVTLVEASKDESAVISIINKVWDVLLTDKNR